MVTGLGGFPTGDQLRLWLARQIEREGEARSAFFLVPLGLMIGIGWVYGLGLRWPAWLAAATAMPVLVLAWRLRGQGLASACTVLAAFILCGVGLAATELALTTTVVFSGEATVRIEGRIAWRDQDERGRMRYLVAIETTDRPVLSRPPARASILVSSRHVPLAVGGRYRGLVRLRAPSGPAYPGAYDFAFAPYFSGLGAHGFGLGAPEPAVAGAPGKAGLRLTIAERLVALRLTISDRIRDAIGGPEGAVASALVTGERAGIPDDVNEWLRSTGLSHVLSISGFHMALVAGFAMLFVRALLAAVPGAVLVVPAKKVAALAALLVATLYLVISGSNVATDRSYIMLSIMLAAIVFDRPALTLRNVAIAAIVVLALSPHALMTASFQMSFAATAALVGAYRGYARWRASSPSDRSSSGVAWTVLSFLGGLALSSLIAGTATAPYAAYHFQRIAPFGLVANLLAMPLFSFWIMPAALVAVLLMPFGLDGPFLWVMGQGLSVVFTIAHALHDVLPDRPIGLVAPLGLLLLTAALLLCCLLASRLRWCAVPLAAAGLLLAPPRAAPPELLIFEDGKQVVLLGHSGALHPLQDRPNRFVMEQWERAFAPSDTTGNHDKTKAKAPAEAGDIGKRAGVASALRPFECEPTQPPRPPSGGGEASGIASAGSASSGTPVSGGERKARLRQICKGTTVGGIKIIWTDDPQMTGLACDSADIAIVARAIALDACRSGTVLVTLRTLRRTGSLAISRSADTGKASVSPSIAAEPEEWNRHRLAPWPEYWRKPTVAEGAAPGTTGQVSKDGAPTAYHSDLAASPAKEEFEAPSPAGGDDAPLSQTGLSTSE